MGMLKKCKTLLAGPWWLICASCFVHIICKANLNKEKAHILQSISLNLNQVQVYQSKKYGKPKSRNIFKKPD